MDEEGVATHERFVAEMAAADEAYRDGRFRQHLERTVQDERSQHKSREDR